MLFEQGEGETVEPGKVFPNVRIANARFIFAISKIEAPMASVFDAPVATHGAGESADEWGLLVLFVTSESQDRSSKRNLVMSSEKEKERCQ